MALLLLPGGFLQFLPPFFTDALFGGSAPGDAGRGLLAVDHLAALAALHSQFIGKYFNLVAAVRAFVYRDT